MENKVLLKNIGQIACYDKELADKILMFDIEKSNISLCETQKKEYNIIFNNTVLHSQEGAELEAQNIVQKIEEKENPNAIRIIYGFGLGYLVDVMANVITKEKIIVYEPNLEILGFVFSIAEVDAIFKNNVIICTDKDKLSNYIESLCDSETKITVSFLSSYKKLYFEDIKNVVSLVEKAQGRHFAYKNTLSKKALKAIFNTLYNIRKIYNNPSICQLKGIYKDKTAIILSAGPSLKDNIEIIRDNQDKFVIFAVNPTIKLLSKYNIKPDFIVDIETVDNTSQFDSINTEEHYFIIEGFVNINITKFKTKKTFNYISNNNFYNDWLRDCLNIKENLESLGTVSYSAFISAYLMGFNKIILCGQDLAYKDGNCYAKGSQYGQLECIYDENEKKYIIKPQDFEAYANSFVSKSIPVEKARICAQKTIEFFNKNIYTVKSQEGKDIPTQTGYALFIEYFENIAKKIKNENPDIELINASFGGAQINGYKNINLKEIVNALEPVEKLDLKDIEPNIDRNYIAQKIENLKQFVSQTDLLYKEAVSINKKLLNELKNKKTITPNAQKLIKKHRENLSLIIKKRDDKETGFIATTYIYRFINKLDCDYFSNIESAIETIEYLIKIFEKTLISLEKLHKRLCNSQSVILE